MTPKGVRAHAGAGLPSDIEWDVLATALNHLGITHVAPTRRRRRAVPTDPTVLFERLARAAEPRLRQAALLLLLTYPGLAPDAQLAITHLDEETRDRAKRRYAAAAAMQRMARTRLELLFGPQPPIPPAYLDELALPPLDEEFGERTLWELSQQEEALYGYDAWGTYRGLLDLLLAEGRRRTWGNRGATAHRPGAA